MTPATITFDYTSLPAGVAADVRATAERVRTAHTMTITAIIEIGRDLLAVKEQLDHGRFGAWLAGEFGWSDRTARNYMAAAESLGLETETISVLQPVTVYALASPSLPANVRERVVSELASGELKADAVPDVIRQARREAAIAWKAEAARRRRAKLSPDQERRAAAAERRRLTEEAQRKVDAGRREIALDKLVALLRTRLGDDEKRWFAEAAPDLQYQLQDLAERVCAAEGSRHG